MGIASKASQSNILATYQILFCVASCVESFPLTSDHLTELSRQTHNIVMLFDSDEAGTRVEDEEGRDVAVMDMHGVAVHEKPSAGGDENKTAIRVFDENATLAVVPLSSVYPTAAKTTAELERQFAVVPIPWAMRHQF